METGEPITAPVRSDLEEAQNIMYEAWSARSRKKRIQLARKALSISQGCADAYVLLAEEVAKSAQEAREFYAQGVKAGERALGEDFESYIGGFWGFIETRPYMRARAGLAECLWIMGEKQEAIKHYLEMIELNPNDNQGIRYTLMNLLSVMEDDQTLEKLLKQYPDDASAQYGYTRALLTFRREGASEAATRELKEAIDYNSHVPQYLLGKKRIPRYLPPYMGFGDKDEAIHYAVEAKEIWKRNKGAIEWLKEVLADLGS